MILDYLALVILLPGLTVSEQLASAEAATREARGQILAATPETAHGYVPVVVFDYDGDVAGLNLPIGAQASTAVYTDRVHALSFLRKIILRIKGWENFVF